MKKGMICVLGSRSRLGGDQKWKHDTKDGSQNVFVFLRRLGSALLSSTPGEPLHPLPPSHFDRFGVASGIDAAQERRSRTRKNKIHSQEASSLSIYIYSVCTLVESAVYTISVIFQIPFLQQIFMNHHGKTRESHLSQRSSPRQTPPPPPYSSQYLPCSCSGSGPSVQCSCRRRHRDGRLETAAAFGQAPFGSPGRSIAHYVVSLLLLFAANNRSRPKRGYWFCFVQQ
jgi:hypothetical protein